MSPESKDRFEKHVTVLVTPPPEGEKERFCRVEPSVVYVRRGGTVTFRSKCGALTVFVPRPHRAPRPFQRIRGAHTAIPGTRGGRTLTVPEGAGRFEYPYAIYSHAHNCFAKGSMPRMVIGP